MKTAFIPKIALRWLGLAALVAAPLFVDSHSAIGGPGADSAVGLERADQCSLPPFLNVAITEKPNIMVVYDNSVSMSLQAYSKDYNPSTHYYGLYNADTCYSYSGGVFTKGAAYPEEVIDPGTGPAYENPALKTDPDTVAQHGSNAHFCFDAATPWSGNFLNWMSMRRVDLLRKAFTGGLSSGGGGNRDAPSIIGESDFAPCFNKSYNVPLTYGALDYAAKKYYVVDPAFGTNIFGRVLDGTFVLGYTCAAGTEVLSQAAPLAPATMVADAGATDNTFSAMVRRKVEAMKTWLASFRGVQTASLFNVMSDAGQAIIGAATPDLELQAGWKVTSGGVGITTGYPGQSITVTADITNLSNGTNFAGDVGGFRIVLSPGPTASSGDSLIGTCNVPAIAKKATATVTCTVTIPAGLSPSAYNAPDAKIGLFINSDNTPNESSVANNWGQTDFDLVQAVPDLVLSSMNFTDNGAGSADIDYTLVNDGVATGVFDVDVFFSVDAVAGNGDDLASTTCTAGVNMAQAETLSKSCTVAIPALCTPSCNVIIVADLKGNTAPAETDVSNNSQTYVYTIAVAGTFEVGFSNVVIPATVSAGGTLTITYDIKNTGTKVSDPITVTVDVGGGVASAVCAHAAVAGKATASYSCAVAIPIGAATGTPAVTLTMTTATPDAVVANNKATGTTKITAAVSVCATVKDCTYSIDVDFFGRRRTGILWSFNKKEFPAGQVAPANLGLTKFTDWRLDGTGLCNGGASCTGNEFDGVQEGQSMSNSVVPHLEAAAPDMPSAPLAQMLLNVIKYYQAQAGFKKASDSDPFLYDVDAAKDGTWHKCRRNYVLYISDGLSYGDKNDLPAAFGGPNLRWFANNLSDPSEAPVPQPMVDNATYDVYKVPNASKLPVVGTNGTYHLDQVALYANAQAAPKSGFGGYDMRPDGPAGSRETIQTVFVHVFSDSGTSTTNFDRASRLMRRAAINGSYVERDGYSGPTSKQEWDSDSDNLPDGYFQAKEGDDVGQVILNALNSILLKTASGTSVSVIASTARGEGAVYQSYFRPSTAEAGREINWIGFLQALWVDSDNNLREDTDQDGGLALEKDKVVETVFNALSKETFAYLHKTDASGNVLSTEGPYSLSAIKPIFESGAILHGTEAEDRTIYTFPHWATEVVPTSYPIYFTDAEVDNCGGGGGCLKKHLWPGGNMYYDDVKMSEMLMRWVRGDDFSDDTFRKRTLTIDGVENTWKLGDIVYSTPAVVGTPEERYDLLYGGRQEGYADWFVNVRNRRRMVYVGANDGMVHGFNGGIFRSGDRTGTGYKEQAWYDPQGSALGKEMWAYVPGSLLPNLRILADAGYDNTCHVYYVDLKPKITDVQIFFDSSNKPIDDAFHRNGWGTILIGGMRLGCGKVQFSSYFILDVSNPEEPYVLAEFGPSSVTAGGKLPPAGVTDLSGLDFSYFYPTVLRIDDTSRTVFTSDGAKHDKAGKWYLIVGSGPDSLAATSSQPQSYIYAFDLSVLGVRDGSPPKLNLEDFAYAFDTFEDGTTPLLGKTMISNGLTGDLDADFSVDVAYLVAQQDRASAGIQYWRSGVWRLNTFEKPDPTAWTVTNLFRTDTFNGVVGKYQSLTAAPSLSRDNAGNIWLYFGTGRFLYKGKPTDIIDDINYGSTASTTFQQQLYGIIDPCWDPNQPCAVTLPMDRGDLEEANKYRVYYDPVARKSTVACSYSCPAAAAVNSCTFSATVVPTSCQVDNVANYVSNPAYGKYGWTRLLTGKGTTWEMSPNKPAVAGGVVLFTTYTPDIDSAACTVGGSSSLYILDYRTGTATGTDAFGSVDTTSTSVQELSASTTIGQEPPSPPSIFNKQVYVQGSNAKITSIKTNVQTHLPPHIRNWIEY